MGAILGHERRQGGWAMILDRFSKTAVLLAVGLLSAMGRNAPGQDLGKLLEDTARKELRQALSPNEARPARAGAGTRPTASQTSATQAAEPFTIKTRDGWNLVAFRFRPTSSPRPGAMPVILCHGLTYNSSFWDLDPSCSLARYLSSQGFDVWTVNLRGCGLSQKWVWNLENAPAAVIDSALRRLSRGKPGSTGYATIDPRFANWTLDDHIAQDVPALVFLVRRITKANEVAWIGHSMGGIVALGHLARYRNPGIGRLVTVGSQVTMPKGLLAGEFLREMVALRQKQLAGQATGDDLAAMARSGVHNMFFNVNNALPGVYQALTGPATDVPALGLMLQYRTLSERGVLLDAKGQYSYARGLGNITIPILISCGAGDQFAPPSVQEFLYRHVGSADKTLIIFGRRQGMSVDAGHDDALVGLNSREQVYPIISRWLTAPPRTAAAQP
jgi:pimeloyl-ACP methyl ester carboxylesterase